MNISELINNVPDALKVNIIDYNLIHRTPTGGGLRGNGVIRIIFDHILTAAELQLLENAGGFTVNPKYIGRFDNGMKASFVYYEFMEV